MLISNTCHSKVLLVSSLCGLTCSSYYYPRVSELCLLDAQSGFSLQHNTSPPRKPPVGNDEERPSPSDSLKNNSSIRTGETPSATTERPYQSPTSTALLTREDIPGIELVHHAGGRPDEFPSPGPSDTLPLLVPVSQGFVFPRDACFPAHTSLGMRVSPNFPSVKYVSPHIFH